eukprot:jgi/Bigna1/64710/fgenesh1_kg.82_\
MTWVDGFLQPYLLFSAAMLPNLKAAGGDVDGGKARSSTCHSLSWCVQEEGDIVFVPVGWHHMVINLETCVSFTRCVVCLFSSS